jgi:hypothetical protein
MSIRVLLACLLLSALTACGAANNPAAPESGGQSNDSRVAAPPSAGVPAKPAEATRRPGGQAAEIRSAHENALPAPNTRLTSFTAQADQQTPEATPAQPEAGAAPVPGQTEDADHTEDIVLLAQSIAELRVMVQELRDQNLQILAALGSSPEAGVRLADPAAPPPPAGSLAEIVLDLRETVAHLAAESEVFGKLLQEQTTALKPVAAAPTQGTLIVENNTDSDQYVWINGVGRWVWARSEVKVTVPVGQVTTKLSGEPERTWEITAPDYEEHIEFVRP